MKRRGKLKERRERKRSKRGQAVDGLCGVKCTIGLSPVAQKNMYHIECNSSHLPFEVDFLTHYRINEYTSFMF